MGTSLVLTIAGMDKPGLVRALSDAVSAHGANWEESRMAHMAGRFVGILHVTVAEPEADALTASLSALESQGLTVRVERGGAGYPSEGFRPLRLEVVANDRPGIVREISGVLAAQGVNVQELITERRSAPHDGGMLFVASAWLLCPPALSRQHLTEELEAIANDLVAEITLEEG